MDIFILITIALVQSVLSMPFQSEPKHRGLSNDWLEDVRYDSETPMMKTRLHWLPTNQRGILVGDSNSPFASEQILTRIRRILADY
nr:hypothetical protein HmN_000382900 [Hymenolepis microstoma]